MEELEFYIENPEPFAAFQLAYAYEQLQQYAGAIEFYLEAADNSELPFLVYESLVRAAICYSAQGGREKTVKDLLFNAIAYNPKAREAHFVLCRFYETTKEWHESYMHACIGLSLSSNVCVKPIAGYVAKSFHFQKAVAAWWIGKTDESRNIMYEVYQESRPLRDAAFNNHRSIGYPRDLWAYDKSKHYKLINKFQGSSLIERSYSQAAQDMFVITALQGLRKGTYLEIGSADPIMFNNTYLLEKDFEWNGISLDISYPDVAKFNVKRKNLALCRDATIFDYKTLDLPLDFDYLQADCEPPPVTFEILKRVLDQGFRPKVITFEHDRYLFGDSIADHSRALLKGLGYTLVVKDVCFDERGSPFEDWWILGNTSLPIKENILGIDYILKK